MHPEITVSCPSEVILGEDALPSGRRGDLGSGLAEHGERFASTRHPHPRAGDRDRRFRRGQGQSRKPERCATCEFLVLPSPGRE